MRVELVITQEILDFAATIPELEEMNLRLGDTVALEKKGEHPQNPPVHI